MRSFAIWYTFKDNELQKEPTEAEVHVNLFKAENNNEVKIDFGIFVDNVQGIKSISLYCPFEIEDVFDLGGIIKNKLLKGIFNENYIDKSGVPKRTYVEDFKTNNYFNNRKWNDDSEKNSRNNNRKLPFFIYQLSDSEINKRQICKDNIHKGTIIDIDTKTIIDANEKFENSMKNIFRYYFRIRILANIENFKNISYCYDGVKFLQVSLAKTEVIDFRLNDNRSLCDEVVDEIYKKQEFNIRAIHYLVLRDARDEFLYHGKQPVSTRLLEDEIWSKYFFHSRESENDHGDSISLIAYHFKKIKCKVYKTSDNEYVDDFIVLSRFRSSETVVQKYVLWSIVISCICSIISSLIYSKYLLGKD